MWRTIKIDVQVGELTLPKILQSEKSFADTSGEWNLILVDRNHYIPNNYQVELTELSNGKKVDSRIYPELQQMFNDARAEGLALFVREGYRTTEEQQKIMDEKINEYEKQGYSAKEAKKRAEKYVAIPDTSEHQLGLSVDINADTDKCSSEKVYQWLDENAYKYGFVKRYPEDKTDITGISNEPWHYRYVGTTVAKIMKEEKIFVKNIYHQYLTYFFSKLTSSGNSVSLLASFSSNPSRHKFLYTSILPSLLPSIFPSVLPSLLPISIPLAMPICSNLSATSHILCTPSFFFLKISS